MYSWDEAKRKANIAKHGIDFVAAAGFDWETAETWIDDRFDYGEVREVAIGFIGPRLCTLVFTRRAAIHIISLRKANRREMTRYDDAQ